MNRRMRAHNGPAQPAQAPVVLEARPPVDLSITFCGVADDRAPKQLLAASDFVEAAEPPVVPEHPVRAPHEEADYEINVQPGAPPAPSNPAPPAGRDRLALPGGEVAEDGQFLAHLSLLLNEWFSNEISVSPEEEEETECEISPEDSQAKRRERTYALLREHKGLPKAEPERFLDRLGQVGNNAVAADETPEARRDQRSSVRESKQSRKNQPTTVPLRNGMRKEVFRDGSFVVKDAVGRVTEAHSHEGAVISYSYDDGGRLKSFVRADSKGQIHTTGVKDRHGVVVRDDHGAVRAQGDSMTVDSNGCVSIRKFDGQFWSLDVLRGIHIERRILEDVGGGWNCLTALLTSDGFRMVTRFQRLQENKRESYRKYGDWLGSEEASKFRFYGRDGSMIQFDNDEDLEALRPSRIWSAGSRPVEREWVGRRQAGTAWEAVHRYISQYLSAL